MSAITFLFWRFMEIITLIPILGMFAHLLRQYLNANILAPDHILILFITSALGVPYCIFTLFTYHRSPGNCRLVSIIDFGFFGTLIAAVYELRFIRNADCTDIQQGDPITLSLGIFGSANLNTVKVSVDQGCAMLKAGFAMGIMNVIFFFITGVVAWLYTKRVEKNRTPPRSRWDSRSSHHSRHRSRSGHGGSRSSHSHSRAYV